MAELKRYFTKYIRDCVKSKYKRGTECEVCGTTENLQFHHFNTLSILVNTWQRKNKINVKTAEEAYEHRDSFIEQYRKELIEDTVTLCKEHHQQLHSVYGKNPNLGTAKKQERWVGKQRAKHGLD